MNVLNTKNNVGFIYVIVTDCYNEGMLHWKKWQNMYDELILLLIYTGLVYNITVLVYVLKSSSTNTWNQ